MKIIHGKTVSEGIAIGKAFILDKKKFRVPTHLVDQPKDELIKLEKSIVKAKEEIRLILKDIQNTSSKEEIEILEAHEAMLDDPDFLESTRLCITDEKMNAALAMKTSAKRFCSLLENLDDEYLKARANDIQDVSYRILKYLLNIEFNDFQKLTHPSIIVSEELTVNDISGIDKNLILGFVTSKSGFNDHAAILARAYNFPLITGVNNILTEIKNSCEVILDGTSGKIFMEPDELTRKEKLNYKEKYSSFQLLANKNAFQKAKTKDGHAIQVNANIEGIESAEEAVSSGADGVGLFRSEFIYMNKKILPDEEYQFQIYTKVAEQLNNKEVRLRTLDIGADKKLEILNLPEEENPALGLRALRLMFDREEELLKPQVKAIIRAAKDHNIKMMLPMVTSISEIREFKKLVSVCREELIKNKKEVAKEISIGIMVEVPAVAVLIEKFIEEVDFFSIGTNDLTQYTLSADRTNYAVSHFNEGLHPAVLHLINHVIEAAHKKGKPVAVCGELASDYKVIPILLGLGIDELSVNPSSVPTVKEMIRKISFSDAKKIARKALKMENWDEIQELTKGTFF